MTVNVTVTVCAVPTEGVITTVAVYEPLARPVTFTVKGMVEVALALSLPLVKPTVNQDCDGVPAVHVRPSPPALVRSTDCADGFTPTVVVYVSAVVLRAIKGGATLIVIGTTIGLPATVVPVNGSIALIVTLVVKLEPPGYACHISNHIIGNSISTRQVASSTSGKRDK